MNPSWWTSAAAAFGVVFLAELGDKTQLTALAMASGNHSRLAVFLGASLALCLSTAIAVLAAGWLRERVDPRWIRIAAGLLFVGFGLWTLFSSPENAAG